MTEILVGDIGGTHARFALAEVARGAEPVLGEPIVLQTTDYAGPEACWAALAERLGRKLPGIASIAIAGPIGEAVKLTNAGWSFVVAEVGARIAPDGFHLLNDFGAVAHAAGALPPSSFRLLFGPEEPPVDGVTTVIGPGTGLGVAQLLRRGGRAIAIETEGAHIDFPPVDEVDDAILGRLRRRYGRVSVERIASGPGLAAVHAALANVDTPTHDEKGLWARALDGSDPAAAEAMRRVCMTLGSAAGDLALAHGANAVVLAGGLASRIADHLGPLGFHARFTAKGRYVERMAAMPIRLLLHPQPGLYGAAAAYASEHLP